MVRLRTLGFNVAFVAWTVLLGLAGLVVRAAMPGRAFALARLWTRGTVRLLRRVGGVPIEVSGQHHLPPRGAPALIVSEHRAAIDSLLWFAIVDRPAYVMKRELKRLPLVGPLLEPAGMIPVDRAGGASALRAMLRAGERAVADGRTVVIFPEGTRADRTGAVALQGGVVALAARLAVPVLPVATDSGRTWGRGLLLGRGEAGRPRVIRLRIGPPLAPGRGDVLRAAVETAWRAGDSMLVEPDSLWTTL